MADMDTGPLAWAKDETGNRYLCSVSSLRDPNTVHEEEKVYCVDDDSRLATRHFVPSNSPEGKIKFVRSVSVN